MTNQNPLARLSFERHIITTDGNNYMYVPSAQSHLGKGALGDVYRTADGKHVVKIANRADFREQLQREYILTKDLYDKQQALVRTAYTPSIEISDPMRAGEPALVMPLFETSYAQYFRQVIERDPHDILSAEAAILEAMLQYWIVLEAIVSLRYTCLDRKMNDLYWYQETPDTAPHLVVIDWNIVDDASSINQQAQIVRFAQIWFELMTGRPPRPPLLPFEDRHWQPGFQTRNEVAQEIGFPSVGLRIILREALMTQASTIESDTHKIKEFLSHWQLIVQNRNSNFGTLFSRLPEAEQKAIETDLKVRQGERSFRKDDRLRLMQQARSQAETILQEIASHLTSGDYRTAQNLLREPTLSKDLRAKRLMFLAEALYLDNLDGYDVLRRERDLLIDAVEILNNPSRSLEELTGIRQYIASAKKKSDTAGGKKASEQLQELLAEIDFQLKLSQYSTLLTYQEELKRFSLAMELSLEKEQRIEWLDDINWALERDARAHAENIKTDVFDLPMNQETFFEAFIKTIQDQFLQHSSRRFDFEIAIEKLDAQLQWLQVPPPAMEKIKTITAQARNAIGYIEQLSTITLPEAQHLLEQHQDSPFFAYLTQRFLDQHHDFIDQIQRLGTTGSPQWVFYENYYTRLQYTLDERNLDYLSRVQNLDRGYVERAYEVRRFCHEELPAWIERQDQINIVDFLKRLHQVRVNISDQETFGTITQELVEMVARWQELIQNIENQVQEKNQRLQEQSVALQQVENKVNAQLQSLHQEEQRYQWLQTIWGALNAMDYSSAAELTAKVEDRLTEAEQQEIRLALSRFPQSDESRHLLKQYYQTLVVEQKTLSDDDRHHLRRVYEDSMRNQWDTALVGRLVHLDLAAQLHHFSTQGQQLYQQLVASENERKMQGLYELIRSVINLAITMHQPQVAQNLELQRQEIIKIEQTFKQYQFQVGRTFGDMLFVDTYLHWYTIVQQLRNGFETLIQVLVDENASEEVNREYLDTLMRLSQSLPEIVFYILYALWGQSLTTVLQRLERFHVQNKRAMSIWQAYRAALDQRVQQVQQRGNAGQKYLSYYQQLIPARS